MNTSLSPLIFYLLATGYALIYSNFYLAFIVTVVFVCYRERRQKKNLLYLMELIQRLKSNVPYNEAANQETQASSEPHTPSYHSVTETPQPILSAEYADEPHVVVQEPLIVEQLITPTPRDWYATAAEQQFPVPQSKLWHSIKNFALQGNTPVRVGIILLLIGTGFLLQYSFKNYSFPLEFKFIGIVLVAIVLLIVGWRLRLKRPTYALPLQGGAIGILYLTIFSAMRAYHLLAVEPAFILLVLISVFSAVLAVLQNSRSLAVLGTLGGFLAPVLLGGSADPTVLLSYYGILNTGVFIIAASANPTVLLSYYGILNIGVLIMAAFKSWRSLNWISFIFTFTVFAWWGINNYQKANFIAIEPFLIIFFLLFVANSILFSLKQPSEKHGFVDSSILFATPLVTFSLQALFVKSFAYGLAWSALVLGLFYLGLAWLLLVRYRGSLRLLIESFAALGVLFATLAIPMAVDSFWAAAAWTLEGAGMIWIGTRQRQLLPRIFGSIILLSAATIFYLQSVLQDLFTQQHNLTVGRLLVTAGLLFSSYCLYKARDYIKTFEIWLSYFLLIAGLLFWIFSGIAEINTYTLPIYHLAYELGFFAVSCGVSYAVSRRLMWPGLGYLSYLLLPVLSCLLLLLILSSASTAPLLSVELPVSRHPFQAGGFIAWLLAFIIQYSLLRTYDHAEEWLVEFLAFSHALTLWLLVAIVSWECAWLIDRLVSGAGTWSAIAWALVPTLFTLMISKFIATNFWPLRSYRSTYLLLGSLPIVGFLCGWVVVINFTSTGDPWPLTYIPVINPLDITQLFVVTSLIVWFRTLKSQPGLILRRLWGQVFCSTVGGLLFIALTAMLIRTLHYWFEVSLVWDALFNSVLVQSSLSIFWTLIALATMIISMRRQQRTTWLVGAGLLGVVVVKLFFIDLANTNTLARIVSFLGVGVLLVILGYLSPIPPKTKISSE